MAAKSDYYQILGVSKTASTEEIKSAYRKEALKWHPDRHSGESKKEAERRFKEINEAYQVLSDPQKRSSYDQFGHSAFTPGGGAEGYPFSDRPGSRAGPFSYTYTTNMGENPFEGFDFGDPFDIFETFFGGGFGRQSRRLPRYSIQIDFMEAINGVKKEVSVEGKKRTIKIPAGVNEGTNISFNDFILTVNIRPHKVFQRNGADIYLDLEIPLSLAILGGDVDVPTVHDKEIKLRIRPGTRPGTMIRLRGEGAPVLNGRGRGDQYVKINVAIPEHLTSTQRKLLEDLREQGL
jgi:DnaJ-class molecular chaperone